MKTYLLPEMGTFYKANLHCHSTLSDGAFTPEELKVAYREKGYSILAYTDHEVMIDHSDLNDDHFLSLCGYEMGLGGNPKCCHLNLISKTPKNNRQVCGNREAIRGNSAKYVSEIEIISEMKEKRFCLEHVNRIIREGNENGFLVAYNHPCWSMEDYTDYGQYEGMYAMEIHNTGCILEGYHEVNPRVYDDLLRQGKRLFCLATDDNHNHAPKNSPHYDSFGGWVMVKAESLDYAKVISALENGEFYSSQGPEIFRLYMEENEVHIQCSDVKQIIYSTGIRRCISVLAESGTFVSEAVFQVKPEDTYFRITLQDEAGKQAWTNAYFIGDKG